MKNREVTGEIVGEKVVKYIVDFRSVGRQKMSWTAETAHVDYDWLYSQVKSKGHIMSDEIDFNCEDGTCKIYARFHTVGTFTIKEVPV
jgi:hypothetical protein